MRRPFRVNNKAVSETIGTLLMITLAVTSSSILSLMILNPWQNLNGPEQRYASLSGEVAENDVTLEHLGGEALRPPSSIQFIFRYYENPIDTEATEVTKSFASAELLSFPEFADGYWSIGESISYDPIIDSLFGPLGPSDLDEVYVHCTIVDGEGTLIVFDKDIQDIPLTPYATTYQPLEETISETTATLKMFYNFISNEFYDPINCSARFVLENVFTSDIDVFSIPLHGVKLTVEKALTTLEPGTTYVYYAQINYTDPQTGLNVSMPSGTDIPNYRKSFTTYSNVRGEYKFEDDFDDEQIPKVDGTGYGDYEFIDGQVNRAVKFTTDGYVEVPHHNKFNLTESLNIHAWVKGKQSGGSFAGELTLEDLVDIEDGDGFGFSCKEPDIIHVNENIYAIVCCDNEGLQTGPVLFTITMGENGIIGDDVLGGIELELGSEFSEPDIIRLSETSDMYAIAFGTTLDGTPAGALVTVSISSDGHDISSLSTYRYKDYYGSKPSIVNLDVDNNPNFCISIAYGGLNQGKYHGGYLLTFEIDKTSGIIEEDTNSFPFGYEYCYEPDIAHLSDDLYLLVFAGSNVESIKTVYMNVIQITLDENEEWVIEVLTTLAQVPKFCLEPTIYPLNLDTGTFLLAYGSGAGNPNIGALQTVRASADSIIIIDTLPFSESCSSMDVAYNQDDIYVVAYSSITDDHGEISTVGKLRTIQISPEGIITHTPLDTLDFSHDPDHFGCLDPSLVSLGNNHIAACFGYHLEGSIAFLITAEISPEGAFLPIIEKSGSYGLFVHGINLYGSVILQNGDVLEEHTVLGVLLDNDWTEVEFSLDANSLILTINSNIYSKSVSGVIKKTSSPLRFGYFPGALDEVRISRTS